MSKFMIGLIVAGVVLAGGLWYASSVYTSVRNEGRTREQKLNAEYKAMMADYGQFRASCIDQLGIAKEKSGAMDKILTDAISGRYNKKGTGEVESGNQQGSLMFAVSEAYPDLKGLDIYDKIVGFVATGRKEFAQRQEKIAGSVADYNTWRTTGSLLHPLFASWIGFPSDAIEIKIGDKTYKGKEALDKMSTVIMTAEAGKIFDSGVDEQLPTK